MLITEKGYGKRTPLSDYRTQNRYGQGVRAMILSPERTGKIIGARVVTSGDESYTFFAKQMYATGLQVAKDPGVWIVYLGCFLMMAGLYVAFFMSHRRIWLVFDEKDNTALLLAGSTNKNKIGFEKNFLDMEEAITGKKSNE